MRYSKKIALFFCIVTTTYSIGMKKPRKQKFRKPPLEKKSTEKMLSIIAEKFHLAVGPKCETTMSIINFLKMEQKKNRKVLAFNYGKQILKTPGGTTFPATKIHHALSIQNHIDLSKNVHAIGIDGAEKFSDSLVRVISNLDQQGIFIYAAFFRGKNPSLEKKLMRISKNTHFVKPKCITCNRVIPYFYYKKKQRKESYFTTIDWNTENENLDGTKQKIKKYLTKYNCKKNYE